MSSTGFIKPGNALAVVLVIGLAATVVVGAEGDADSLLQSGKEQAVDAARDGDRLTAGDARGKRNDLPRRGRRESADSGAFTREEELIDSAAGEAPRGYEIEPTFDSGVPHKIDPEAEAKEAARRIAADDDAVAIPRAPGSQREDDQAE